MKLKIWRRPIDTATTRTHNIIPKPEYIGDYVGTVTYDTLLYREKGKRGLLFTIQRNQIYKTKWSML